MHRILARATLLLFLSNPGCLCAAPSVRGASPDPASPAGSSVASCHGAPAAAADPGDQDGRAPSCRHCQSICANPARPGESQSSAAAPMRLAAILAPGIGHPAPDARPQPPIEADPAPPFLPLSPLESSGALLI